ncbi:MAG: ABC transporter permease [Thermoplasmata archaeon]
MVNALLNIIIKELKEMIRDPRLMIGMILVPLLIFPIMGSALNVSMEAAKESLKTVKCVFVNMDGDDGNSTISDVLYNYLINQNIVLLNVSTQNISKAINEAQQNGVSLVLEVPVNFTETIIGGNSTKLNVYQILKSYGITESGEFAVLSSAISGFNDYILYSRLVSIYPDAEPDEILHPIRIEEKSVIKGNVRDVSPLVVVTGVMSGGIAMPVVIMILLMMAGQLAATSVAMEKEQKTLEVLLTLPTNRIYLLFGKIAGVIVLSIVATISYLIGFTYYMSSLTSNTPRINGQVNLVALGLVPDFQGYLLMILSIFLAFLAVLSLAVLLGAYTKDVRSAQALSGVLYIPILIPVLILMMAPLEALPLSIQALIYALPFSYPVLATKCLYTQEYSVLYLGILYQIVFTCAILYIASKFFTSEKILTAKIQFKKRKGMEE